MGIFKFGIGVAVGCIGTTMLSNAVKDNIHNALVESRETLRNKEAIRYRAYKYIQEWKNNGQLPQALALMDEEIANFEAAQHTILQTASGAAY